MTNDGSIIQLLIAAKVRDAHVIVDVDERGFGPMPPVEVLIAVGLSDSQASRWAASMTRQRILSIIRSIVRRTAAGHNVNNFPGLFQSYTRHNKPSDMTEIGMADFYIRQARGRVARRKVGGK